jgi:hypothetical protein
VNAHTARVRTENAACVSPGGLLGYELCRYPASIIQAHD